MDSMAGKYAFVFSTDMGKEVLDDILKRLGYGEYLSRENERSELKAVALHDFAVELKELIKRGE